MTNPTVVSETVQMFEGKRCTPSKGGYFRSPRWWLHRRVWEAAHGPIPPGHHVHHKDHDKANNALANLEVIEGKEHRRRHQSSPEYREKMRVLMTAKLDTILPLAAEWHGSPEGREWHSANAKGVWRRRKARSWNCQHCGTPFEATS